MGLFDTKYCAVCNNKKGLFGYKLKDGAHLCRKCGKKFAYDEFVLGVTNHRHRRCQGREQGAAAAGLRGSRV